MNTMKKFIILFPLLLFLSASAAKRPTPAYLRRATVYQIVLRSFTRDGNFKAATKMLGHVRSTGADVVYLAPFVAMDCDMDRSGWSPRQRASGFDSPKNPYRIADYDRIDPEYGGDADFQEFNDRAHALGMKVYMDLVYLHCGPNNVLKDKFPDAFQKNPDGTVKTTEWRFPFVNFESKGVRRYLIDSMLHWMRLGCDGFRCDVGDKVPIDFWVEAATACRKVNPELVMINEGTKPEWLEKAFDACYAWPWSFHVRGTLVPKSEANAWWMRNGRSLAERMQEVRDYEAKIPKDSLMFAFVDNHDTAADDKDLRFDRALPVDAGNAAYVLTFLRRGLPLVFSGNEIADPALNATLGPVEHPLRAAKTIDWARALQPDGQRRIALIRRLAKLHHDDPVFYDGEMDWVTDGEAAGVVAFVRRLGDRRVFVAANLTEKDAAFKPGGVALKPGAKRLLGERVELRADGTCALGPYGFVAVECEPFAEGGRSVRSLAGGGWRFAADGPGQDHGRGQRRSARARVVQGRGLAPALLRTGRGGGAPRQGFDRPDHAHG